MLLIPIFLLLRKWEIGRISQFLFIPNSKTMATPSITFAIPISVPLSFPLIIRINIDSGNDIH
jgi:hypothetical protein